MVSVADNLRQLRVDPKRLAKRTGISTSRIEELFAGHSPTATELRLISQYLKLPADALLRNATHSSQSDVRYRKTPRKIPPIAAEARMREIAGLFTRNQLMPAAESNLRVYASLQDRPSIEQAAVAIRQRICQRDEWLDPLPDLVDRVDRAGLASCLVLHDLGVEGASTSIHSAGLIIIAARSFAPRMLFTCAHELAHVVLGHTDSGKWLIDEDTIEAFDSTDDEERLCNTLASALLQPAEAVAHFLQVARKTYDISDDELTDTEVFLIARYFGTSFFTAAMRLEHLDIAPPGFAKSFEDAIKRTHKSPETYANQLNLPRRTRIEMPVLSPVLRERLAEAVDDGQVSIGRLGDILGYSTIEISDALT